MEHKYSMLIRMQHILIFASNCLAKSPRFVRQAYGAGEAQNAPHRRSALLQNCTERQKKDAKALNKDRRQTPRGAVIAAVKAWEVPALYLSRFAD